MHAFAIINANCDDDAHQLRAAKIPASARCSENVAALS